MIVNKKKKSTSSRLTGQTGQTPSLERVPVAIGSTRSVSAPMVNGKDRFNVRRKEFVGSLTNGSVTGYALTPVSASTPGYDFNPSEATLFPWLAQIASRFERFRFNRLSFHFYPSQATSTAGRFYAAVDYDYDDAVASSKSVLMGNATAIESAVWQPVSLTCDPNMLNRDLPYRYVSCTTRGLSVEQRTAFAGFLMVGFDTPTANCLVDLWVEYDVDLVTPVFDDAIIQDIDNGTGGLPAVAAVTSAVGTGFATSPLFYNVNMTTGPVKVVKPGSNEVPVLSNSYATGSLSSPSALDLSQTNHSGVMSIFQRFIETGVAPVTNLGGILLEGDARIFDSLGNYLGMLSSVGSALWKQTWGTIAGGLYGLSQPVQDIMTFTLRALFNKYPSARYLAPIIMSTQAIGAGSCGFGFTYTK